MDQFALPDGPWADQCETIAARLDQAVPVQTVFPGEAFDNRDGELYQRLMNRVFASAFYQWKLRELATQFRDNDSGVTRDYEAFLRGVQYMASNQLESVALEVTFFDLGPPPVEVEPGQASQTGHQNAAYHDYGDDEHHHVSQGEIESGALPAAQLSDPQHVSAGQAARIPHGNHQADYFPNQQNVSSADHPFPAQSDLTAFPEASSLQSYHASANQNSLTEHNPLQAPYLPAHQNSDFDSSHPFPDQGNSGGFSDASKLEELDIFSREIFDAPTTQTSAAEHNNYQTFSYPALQDTVFDLSNPFPAQDNSAAFSNALGFELFKDTSEPKSSGASVIQTSTIEQNNHQTFPYPDHHNDQNTNFNPSRSLSTQDNSGLFSNALANELRDASTIQTSANEQNNHQAFSYPDHHNHQETDLNASHYPFPSQENLARLYEALGVQARAFFNQAPQIHPNNPQPSQPHNLLTPHHNNLAQAANHNSRPEIPDFNHGVHDQHQYPLAMSSTQNGAGAAAPSDVIMSDSDEQQITDAQSQNHATSGDNDDEYLDDAAPDHEDDQGNQYDEHEDDEDDDEDDDGGQQNATFTVNIQPKRGHRKDHHLTVTLSIPAKLSDMSEQDNQKVRSDELSELAKLRGGDARVKDWCDQFNDLFLDNEVAAFAPWIPQGMRAEVRAALAQSHRCINDYYSGHMLIRDMTGKDAKKGRVVGDSHHLPTLKEWIREKDHWALSRVANGGKVVMAVPRAKVIALAVLGCQGVRPSAWAHEAIKAKKTLGLLRDCRLLPLVSAEEHPVVDFFWRGWEELARQLVCGELSETEHLRSPEGATWEEVVAAVKARARAWKARGGDTTAFDDWACRKIGAAVEGVAEGDEDVARREMGDVLEVLEVLENL